MKIDPKTAIATILKQYFENKVETEYRFHAKRRWRFDWAIPSEMMAIEYEGGIFNAKSRHFSGMGAVRDCEKYRHAAMAGWCVLRYSVKDFNELDRDLAEMIGFGNLPRKIKK